MNQKNYKAEKLQKIDNKIKKLQQNLSKNFFSKRQWRKHTKLFERFENERMKYENQIFRNQIVSKEVESVQREARELEAMISFEKQNCEEIRSSLNYLDEKINDMGKIGSSIVDKLLDSRNVKEEVDQMFRLGQAELVFSQNAIKLNLDGVNSSEDDLTTDTDVDSSKDMGLTTTEDEEESEDGAEK